MDLKDFTDKGFKLVKGQLIKPNAVKKTSEDTQRPKQSKYKNIKVVDGERVYDSKKESEFAKKLDLQKAAGEVLYYDVHVAYPIYILKENKNTDQLEKIKIANYELDFEVTYKDFSRRYFDVKGFDKRIGKFRTTADFKLKKKLVEAIYGINIELVTP
jgi:hypothetical protein